MPPYALGEKEKTSSNKYPVWRASTEPSWVFSAESEHFRGLWVQFSTADASLLADWEKQVSSGHAARDTRDYLVPWIAYVIALIKRRLPRGEQKALKQLLILQWCWSLPCRVYVPMSTCVCSDPLRSLRKRTSRVTFPSVDLIRGQPAVMNIVSLFSSAHLFRGTFVMHLMRPL